MKVCLLRTFTNHVTLVFVIHQATLVALHVHQVDQGFIEVIIYASFSVYILLNWATHCPCKDLCSCWFRADQTIVVLTTFGAAWGSTVSWKMWDKWTFEALLAEVHLLDCVLFHSQILFLEVVTKCCAPLEEGMIALYTTIKYRRW